ncbi:hypothetical protein NDU88_003301 [Pleurodeles waltl]|uniref:Uncharacterized protein n=1 Tax=Pleurodeles waltl TaxID=8319 RepID=A0AAV7V0A9_PLEWA|nr:hypothetical protein NDU88_003301 [Pleurodeles waltl]
MFLSPLSGAARHSSCGRAPTTRRSAPFLRGSAPPQVVQCAATGRRAIAGRRRATGLGISGRPHPRSAMLDAGGLQVSVCAFLPAEPKRCVEIKSPSL